MDLALIYFSVARFLLPLLAIIFFVFLTYIIFKNLKRKTLARFAIDGYSNVVEIKSSECLLGSGITCDVRLKDQRVHKHHALLALTDYGFKLTPMSEDAKVYVNNYLVEEEAYLQSGDTILLGTTAVKIAINPAISTTAKQKSDKDSTKTRICATLILSLFQLFSMLSVVLKETESALKILGVFSFFIAFEWIYLAIKKFKTNVGVELAAFFLTTIGLLVSASVGVDSLFKRSLFTVVGIVFFLLLLWLLNYLQIVEKLKIPVMIASVLLLIFNIAFGTVTNGALNWVAIGGFSFQPSEFVKVALVFISAGSIEKMVKTKSLISFLGFVLVCLLSLAYMRDFGSAFVYFIALLVILCLRLCDIKIVLAIASATAVAGFTAIQIFPYISDRFSTYRHAWEYASSGGYQQTRSMIAIASGGLLGLGPKNGNLKYVSAADTDLVFGMVSEELGLIIALIMALLFALLMIYAGICVTRTRSIYYAVTAAAAASIFLAQASLNIFGSVDLLPLTGVTIPFVSTGGSSLIASWMLLAFIKQSGAKFVVLQRRSED